MSTQNLGFFSLRVHLALLFSRVGCSYYLLITNRTWQKCILFVFWNWIIKDSVASLSPFPTHTSHTHTHMHTHTRTHTHTHTTPHTIYTYPPQHLYTMHIHHTHTLTPYIHHTHIQYMHTIHTHAYKEAGCPVFRTLASSVVLFLWTSLWDFTEWCA
jgi:hypothetical protein